jgi:hypothetical protein
LPPSPEECQTLLPLECGVLPPDLDQAVKTSRKSLDVPDPLFFELGKQRRQIPLENLATTQLKPRSC